MAATVTITHPRPEQWIVDIVESSTSNGESVEIQPLAGTKFPKGGRLIRVQSELISGDASQITPILSSASTFTADLIVAEVGPGVQIDEQEQGGWPYGLVGDTLYHRSNPNAGSNNVIKTRYLISDGWE